MPSSHTSNNNAKNSQRGWAKSCSTSTPSLKPQDKTKITNLYYTRHPNDTSPTSTTHILYILAVSMHYVPIVAAKSHWIMADLLDWYLGDGHVMDMTFSPIRELRLYIHLPILDRNTIFVPFSCAIDGIGTHKANKGLDHELSAWK